MVALLPRVLPTLIVLSLISNVCSTSGYLGFSSVDPRCKVVEENVTCSGNGTLTKEHVRIGVYTGYKYAVVEEGITALGEDCFRYCSALIEIKLPTSLTKFGSNALGAAGIANLTIPGKLVEFVAGTVNSCSNLVGIHTLHSQSKYKDIDGILMNGTKVLAVGAGRCAGGELTLPSTATEIQGNALRWTRAASIVIPNKVTSVGGNAFYKARFLTTLTIGKAVTSISDTALEGCAALTTITIHEDNNVFYIAEAWYGSWFGKKSSKGQISILWCSPDSVKAYIGQYIADIGRSAFQSCENLTTLMLNGDNKNFKLVCNDMVLCEKVDSKWRAAYVAGGITKVDLTAHTDVTQIGNSCFRSCKKLETAVLHKNINRLGAYAFNGCTALTSIDFKSCKMLNINGDPYMPSYFAKACPNLVSLLNYPSNNHGLFTDALGATGITSWTIPSCVVNTSDLVFENCVNLTSVVIPATMDVIGYQCFKGCTALKNVTFTLPSFVTTISSMCFADCQSLETIALPTSVISLDPSCFSGCINLVSIVFTSPDEGHFRSDGTAVYEPRRSANGETIEETYHKFVICPPGLSVIEFHPNTSIIGNYAFYGCNNLRDVIMNDIVEEIEESGFYQCNYIRYIRLTASIKKIGANAFNSCQRLRKILYCSNRSDVFYTWDPFPTNPDIYLFYDYPESTFCEHPCFAIMDKECNIPTEYFTNVFKPLEQGNVYKIFGTGITMVGYISFASDSL